MAGQLVKPLEQYREMHGSYPENLEVLAETRATEDGADQHQWDVFDSRIGRWERR